MSKSAAKKIQAIRGMNDLLPSESPRWQFFEAKVRQLMHRYGFDEIRTPIVEQTALFARSIGEVTDIVEKRDVHVRRPQRRQPNAATRRYS